MRYRFLSASLLLGLLASVADASAQRARRPTPRGPTVAEIQISGGDVTIAVGERTALIAFGFDAQGNPVGAATFTWSSSNVRVAAVDQEGTVTGRGPGVANIVVRSGSVSAQTAIAVRAAEAPAPVARPPVAIAPTAPVTPEAQPPPRRGPAGPGTAALARQPPGTGPAAGLVVTPPRLVLVPGESAPLEYRAVQADGSAAEPVPIVFTAESGGRMVLTVDSFGVITAGRDTGSVVVRASVPGQSALSRPVSVEVRADSVVFDPGSVSLSPGQVDTLRLMVPAQDRPLSARHAFQFASSDTSKVRVSPLQPIVQARAAGSATITANSPFHEDISATVSVHRPVARLAVTPSDTVIYVGISGSRALEVNAVAEDSTPVAEAVRTWTPPDSAIARFDPRTRTVRGVAVGTTAVSVTVLGREGPLVRSWTVRVIAGGLSLSVGGRVGLGVGERVPVVGRYGDVAGRPLGEATGLTWRSSDTTVARFSEGAIMAVGRGSARITARAPWDSTAGVDAFVVADLVVSANRGGRWDLYSMLVRDPSNLQPLTSDSIVELQAAWSPDLTRLAYVSVPHPRSTNFQLYAMDADGRNSARILDDSTTGAPAFVPPEGRRLVFESRRTGRPHIYVANLDGTGVQALTSGDTANLQPSVSPDGRRVVFISARDRNYEVYEMAIDGTDQRRLTATPLGREQWPRYSADGRSIYYVRDDGGSPPSWRVWKFDRSTSTAAPVTPPELIVQDFSVSANDSLFALTVRDAGGARPAQVLLFSAATGARTPLPSQAGETYAGPSFRPARAAVPAARP